MAQVYEFPNPVGPEQPRVTLSPCTYIIQASVHMELDLLFRHPFSVVHRSRWVPWKWSGETAGNQEVKLTRQLMLLAWFRWWWLLMITRPQPLHRFRTAGGCVSLLPAATSIDTVSWNLQCPKGDWWLAVFSFYTAFVSFSTDLIPVMEIFAWKFHLCLGNICSPVSFAMTDALLLYWFNNFYSLPSLT